MKINKLKTAAFAVMLTLGFGSGTALAEADTHDPKLLKAVQNYLAAMNEGYNVPVLMDQFTEDAVVLNSNGRAIKGKADLTQAYNSVAGEVDFQISHSVEEVIPLGDNFAFIRMHGSGTLTMIKGGAVVPQELNEVFLVRKGSDGEFLIARYMFNTGQR